MQYLCLDFGGSAMKYAVMNDAFETTETGSIPSSQMQNKEHLINAAVSLYVNPFIQMIDIPRPDLHICHFDRCAVPPHGRCTELIRSFR